MNENLIKVIGSILLIVLAFVFTFIFPTSGIEETIVSILALLGSALGINWRLQYLEIKSWLKSKTIIGALIILIPFLTITFASLGLFSLSEELKTILLGIITGGGLTFLIGIFDTIKSKK